MNSRFVPDEWKIIENRFEPENSRDSESIFSIGNGMMGQRANFEEKYSGDTLQGSYVAGVYYPDKTVVGWWKNGYPEYFAKVPNAMSWIGIDVEIDGEQIDLATCKIKSFTRVLNMKEGLLERAFTVVLPSGRVAEVTAKRFVSMHEPEKAAVKYSVKISGGNGRIRITSFINADVKNEDANYGEKFWEGTTVKTDGKKAAVKSQTRKTGFVVASAQTNVFCLNGKDVTEGNTNISARSEYVAAIFTNQYTSGDTFEVTKYVAVLSSLNHTPASMETKAMIKAYEGECEGFEAMFEKHKDAWAERWEQGDIAIKGDVAAQQGIRFNIFQLYQTYTGEDPRLNIGPKGFTGEKYGGSTYWDTEAFAFTFYLNTADSHVARNLLLYRYKQLDKAIENAGKLGFKDGAALFPMVTMNGEECHNEWEITFEEIHRNGAIAYAIFNYVRNTGNREYLGDYGLDVLVGISRFWSQRATWSGDKKKYVILGVTGPNEYENNVNNNWYTNTIARWTLRYTIESLEWLRGVNNPKYNAVVSRLSLDLEKEIPRWKDIIAKIHLPEDTSLGIFLQQDGYMDKEQILVSDLDPSERPLNQHWSWDRILRSVFIKQADVLQGIYFFEDDYSDETLRRNFDFYEARCVHESSLSPSIHSILAAKLKDNDRAYKLYLRTARLDLDDYNKEVKDGLHITSMAGTWLAIVQGFGGMRIRNDKVSLNPTLPEAWKSFSFIMRFRNKPLKIEVTEKDVIITNFSDSGISIELYGETETIEPGKTCKLKRK
jgi:maltose phosphorylase